MEDQELQMIMNFKVWCKMNNKLLPDTEQEILRHLYTSDSDNARAYSSIKSHFQYRNKVFPMSMTENMITLLNSGGIYIHGRDKNFRPIVIVNLDKL